MKNVCLRSRGSLASLSRNITLSSSICYSSFIFFLLFTSPLMNWAERCKWRVDCEWIVKTHKASMKHARCKQSHQLWTCSFFFFVVAYSSSFSFWIRMESGSLLRSVFWEIQIFLQVSSYKYAMYLLQLIHSTSNNQASESL